jgi:molecular chaperone DnaK
VYAAEKMLKEMGDKVTASDKAAIEASMADVKKALEQNDAAAIKSAMEKLTQAQHKMAEELYKQAGPAAGGGAASEQPGGDASGAGPAQGDVIDAEVVDDGKK